MAKLRENTRSELRKVLSPLEVEEFVLRYSHNAHQLRDELRGIDPTPEEFRKVFRATDPIDHQVQLEFGGGEGMSEKQRERYERERETALRESLGSERYQAYLLTKDPLYRQALLTAQQYGAPPKAIMPIYQMAKMSETRRQKIMQDANLTPQQKSEAINAVNLEQQRSVQQIVSQAAQQRWSCAASSRYSVPRHRLNPVRRASSGRGGRLHFQIDRRSENCGTEAPAQTELGGLGFRSATRVPFQAARPLDNDGVNCIDKSLRSFRVLLSYV